MRHRSNNASRRGFLVSTSSWRHMLLMFSHIGPDLSRFFPRCQTYAYDKLSTTGAPPHTGYCATSKSSAPHDSQGDVRRKIQQPDRQFVETQPAVVHRVKHLTSQLKPGLPVHPVHPVMREEKQRRPHEQQGHIDHRTPAEHASHFFQCHKGHTLLSIYRTPVALEPQAPLHPTSDTAA